MVVIIQDNENNQVSERNYNKKAEKIKWVQGKLSTGS